MIRNQVKLVTWCWGQEQLGQCLRASHLCLQKFDIHPFQLCTYLRLTGQNHTKLGGVPASSLFVNETPQVSRYISVWWFGSLMVLKFRSITMHSSLHRSWHIVALAWSLPSWVSWLLVCGVSPWIWLLGTIRALSCTIRRSTLAQVKQRQQAGGGQRLGAVVQGVVSTQGSIFVASLQAGIWRYWKYLEVMQGWSCWDFRFFLRHVYLGVGCLGAAHFSFLICAE